MMDDEGVKGLRKEQELLAHLCQKYDLGAAEALKRWHVEGLERSIERDTRHAAIREGQLRHLVEKHGASASVVDSLVSLLRQAAPGTAEWHAINDRLAALTRLPDTIREETRLLEQERVRLARQEEYLARLRPSRAEDLLDVRTFRHGYFVEVWQGVEHYLPAGVLPAPFAPSGEPRTEFQFTYT